MRKIIFISLLLQQLSSFCQTPANDPMWGTPTFSDDFTLPYIDGTKWQDNTNTNWLNNYCSAGSDANCSTGQTQAYFYPYLNDPHSTYAYNSGTLSLQVKNISSNPLIVNNPIQVPGCPACSSITYNYAAAGWLTSVQQFSFGYCEIRCKLPALSGSATNNGIGPAFWLYGGPGNCWEEIDLFEFWDTPVKNDWTINSHFKYCTDCSNLSTCDPPGANTNYQTHIDYGITHGSIDFSTYHKFGFGYYPGDANNITTKSRIDTYLDDQFVCTTTLVATSSNLMNIIISMNIGPAYHLIDPTTVMPYSFDVDYVKFYQLTYDCSHSFFPTSYSTPYDNKVKYDIGLGGGSNTYVLPSYITASLKASNTITMDQGFQVDGTDVFIAEVTPCAP